MRNIVLVIIDPQNSFCKVVPQDEQQIAHDGELCVPGAWEDMDRVANMVNRIGEKINDIQITMDSHYPLHIAHPIWFREINNGNNPNPFTLMREENGKILGSVIDADGNPQNVGEFRTFVSGVFQWTLNYLKELNASGRYPHCIWPPHCIIGTAGHNIVEPLNNAILNWELNNGAIAPRITKGSNYRCEHFSAVQAEVTDPDDPSTQMNTNFVGNLMEADEILIAGEALSHCVANTVQDIINHFGDDTLTRKCVLLTDASSNVPGFEQLGTDFVDKMKKRGMQTTTTVDYLT